MTQLIQQLFQGNKREALTQIEEIYQSEGFAIVSYVYGAVIVRNKLLEQRAESREQRADLDPSSLRMTKWREALFGSSIILPDGAALLTWWKVAYWLGVVQGVSHLTNLNGTDFFVTLLEHYLSKGGVNLVCYGVYDEKLGTKKGALVSKAGEWLQEHYGFNWTYAQDINYSNDSLDDRDWDKMRAACNPDYPTIMMVCRGVPRQEIWSYHHRNNLRKYGVIACNQGGTLDYWAGVENRAPRLVRKLWLESVWRVIINPRKNWSKFWVSFQMMGEIVKLLFKSRKVEK